MTPAYPTEPRIAQLDRALVSAFLENIPDRVFFKDRSSRFIAVSRSCVQDFGGATAAQIIGRTDFDFFSAAHARSAYEDEQIILRTGQPILDKVEREIWPDGRVTWSRTSKLPVRNEAGQIIGTFGLSKDITKTREMELALEKVHKELVDASRIAGMAEVANGVLHNVGSVLNSLNVSASMIATELRRSKAGTLGRLAAMLRSHDKDLADFLTGDPKGRRIPELIASLARHAMEQRERFLRELHELQQSIDHIKEIVAMQQAYATTASTVEAIDVQALMEAAVRMNAGSLPPNEIRIERDYSPTPPVMGEKAKVLQILVNLLRNAKFACDETTSVDKVITLRIRPGMTANQVALMVQDNGIGIAEENLTRIFGHGFTTRRNGQGFALHSAANAAREMKGSLMVQSGGVGRGATFILELPAAQSVAAA